MEPIKQLPRISVSFGRKINLGNFESMDVHFSISEDVNEGETKEEVARRNYAQVKAWADATTKRKEQKSEPKRTGN